jgi:cysteine desulfurase
MSASRRIYLDYNATAPVRPEAAEAVARALEVGGNPSSVHAAGRAARGLLEEARQAVAALARARASDVVFTSGGSEANTLALRSAIQRGGAERLIIGATEHASVTETADAAGLPVEAWPVDRRGVADLDWLSDRLKGWSAADGRPFVALMAANNETGVVQPVAEAAELVHAADGWLHVDAVQAAGKIDIGSFPADSLAISAHKLGGPQGSGALIAGCHVELARQAFGGGQEQGRRGGTANLIGAAGFGAAAKASMALGDPRQGAWRDAAAERLKAEAGVVVLGEGAPRLSNTLSIASVGFASDLQVMALDLAGVMVSGGAACSSGKVKASHVVMAMGHEALAGCALRVSGGWGATEDDWAIFVEAWLEAHARRTSRARKFVEA